jgi:hypothetical protein
VGSATCGVKVRTELKDEDAGQEVE